MSFFHATHACVRAYDSCWAVQFSNQQDFWVQGADGQQTSLFREYQVKSFFVVELERCCTLCVAFGEADRSDRPLGQTTCFGFYRKTCGTEYLPPVLPFGTNRLLHGGRRAPLHLSSTSIGGPVSKSPLPRILFSSSSSLRSLRSRVFFFFCM